MEKSDHNTELGGLAVAFIKAAIVESNLILQGVKIDLDPGMGKPPMGGGEKIEVSVIGDVTGKLTLSGATKKVVFDLFNQHKLMAQLKQKDKDIQTMIAEQRDTLAALSKKCKEIEALRDEGMMNKSEATRFAKRLIAGYIERLYNGQGKSGQPDPLVYDEECECEGHRLSARDEDRVEDEVDRILERLYDEGCTSPEDRAGKLRMRRTKPDGKPGPKWKKYEEWQRKQGRRT